MAAISSCGSDPEMSNRRWGGSLYGPHHDRRASPRQESGTLIGTIAGIVAQTVAGDDQLDGQAGPLRLSLPGPAKTIRRRPGSAGVGARAVLGYWRSTSPPGRLRGAGGVVVQRCTCPSLHPLTYKEKTYLLKNRYISYIAAPNRLSPSGPPLNRHVQRGCTWCKGAEGSRSGWVFMHQRSD